MGPRFCIAGFSFEIDCAGDSLASIAADWREFRTSDAPRARIELELTEAVTRPAGAQLLLPKVTRTRTGSLAIEGEGFEAEVSPDARFARVISAPERFPVEAVVRILLADFLLARDGLLLHSVALAVGRRAALFVGESGAGKTTLGALGRQAGLSCLADELVAVVPRGGGYTAFGTPWNVGGSAQAGLAMLGVLAHAASASIDEYPAADVLRALLPNALMPDPSASTRGRMFRCACALIGSVRPVRLRFARDPSVALALVRALEGPRARPAVRPAKSPVA